MNTFPGDVENIFERIFKHSQFSPEKTALILDEGQNLNYKELLAQVQNIRNQLREFKIKSKDRVLVLFPLSHELIILILALFCENIVPVLIDPRLKKKFWKSSISQAQVQVIFSNKKILRLRWFWLWLHRYRLISVDGPSFGVTGIDFRISLDRNSFEKLAAVKNTDEVLVTLSSGTTGLPKIIPRSMQIIKNQQELLCKHLPIVQPDCHLSLYGVAVLQSLAEGAATILTKNFSASHLVKLIQENQVTRISGPPPILLELLNLVQAKQIKLPSVKNILTGGAPIPRWFVRKFLTTFPDSFFDIVYGSTECEPISHKRMTLSDLEANQYGYPVGVLIPEIKLIQANPKNILDMTIFEVELSGPNCFNSDGLDRLCTGDLAYQNLNGELFLVGRKSEMVREFPVGLIEERMENHTLVKRAAVVERDRQIKVFIELHKEDNKALGELFSYCSKVFSDFGLGPFQLKLVKKIPVDRRHGWKIQRHLL